jgi:hypothetical protein
MRRVVWLLSLVACLGVSTLSFAQGEDDESESAATESGDEADAAAASDIEAEAPAANPKPAEAAAAGSGVTPTWWVGPYLEGLIVPSFMLKIFLAAAPSVFNASFGATVTHRNADGFSWVLGLGYAGYAFDGPFRAKGDPELDTEYLNSSIGFVHARGMLLWSADISRTLSFEYGVGIQLGVVVGELRRSEAYKDSSGNYHACAGAGDPRDPLVGSFDPAMRYCEPTTNGSFSNAYNEAGAHYNVKEERVPPVAAALMIPALALRFQPIDQLAIKLEAAFGLMQFSFGLSAAYGIGS